MNETIPNFVRCRQAFCVLLAGMVFADTVSRVIAAPAEVRGTWLTTTGTEDHIRSGIKTEAVMSDLRAIGLNTLYVETWKNGYTNYPSTSLSSLTGGPDRSTFLGTTRDLVDETLIHAHRNGLNYVGWFEYGFSPQFIGNGGTPSNPLSTYMRDQGWLLKDQSGKYGNASNGFAWMNPAVPQVRQFLINVVLEAVERYDLDGIQFDDRLAWPKEFGWDATTAQIYLAETGSNLPTSSSDSRFRQWRQGKVTQFAQELTQAVRAVRPELLLSESPSISGFAETEYNAVWPTWQNQQLFDEYVPQAYRDNLTSFNSIINAQVAPFATDELDELAVGLRINGGPSTPFADVQAMIERTRLEGAAGHSLWYSRGVRDEYATQLTAFYDVAGEGPAANPHFSPLRRPPPLVASLVSASAGTWAVGADTPGRYRVVARFGSFWREVEVLTLGTGDSEIHVAGASQVELLADRRPLSVPDFSGDGFVDITDYALWRDTVGSTLNLLADADADGVVGALDYNRWRSGFGQLASGTAEQAGSLTFFVPEPHGFALVITFFAVSILFGTLFSVRPAYRARTTLSAPRSTQLASLYENLRCHEKTRTNCPGLSRLPAGSGLFEIRAIKWRGQDSELRPRGYVVV